MTGSPIQERMREDWNRRAREDANYYVAFGRHGQDEEEFFETGKEVVHGLEWELKRLPAGANRRAWRALEVGCGPGRLLRPMSRHFGEIHGVDVSDEMVARARRNLRGIPHAHVHTNAGADLAAFADESFDFVYSYAVFQHIPSREVVFSYLREIHRVLKNGGVFRGQFNGLPQPLEEYDTWSGVRIRPKEIAAFTRENDLLLLTLEGVATQYMWTTWQKVSPGTIRRLEESPPEAQAEVRRVTNSHSSEPVAHNTGRYASVSVWTGGLPLLCDLNHLTATVGGCSGRPCYLGPREPDGLQQLNVMIPPEAGTGLLPVEIFWLGRRLGVPKTIRIIPRGPFIPRILSVTDGQDMLSGTRIVTGTVKAVIEEVSHPEEFAAEITGRPIRDLSVFLADPLPPRYEFGFRLPEGVVPGPHILEMRLGRRRFAPVPIEVTE
jgi:ubiquinone/menaquinone biosynthesis C-methylase UbiE